MRNTTTTTTTTTNLSLFDVTSWFRNFRGRNPYPTEEILPGFRTMFKTTYIEVS